MTFWILVFVNPLVHFIVKKFIQPLNVLILQYFRYWVIKFSRIYQLRNIHQHKFLLLNCLNQICLYNWNLIVDIIWRQIIYFTEFVCFNLILNYNWMSSYTVFVPNFKTNISSYILLSKLEHAASFLFESFITCSFVKIFFKFFILFQLIFIFLWWPFWCSQFSVC